MHFTISRPGTIAAATHVDPAAPGADHIIQAAKAFEADPAMMTAVVDWPERAVWTLTDTLVDAAADTLTRLEVTTPSDCPKDLGNLLDQALADGRMTADDANLLAHYGGQDVRDAIWRLPIDWT